VHFREVLDNVASTAPGARRNDAMSHENWKEAVDVFTKHEYRLCEHFYRSTEHLYEVISSKTGNRNVQITGAALAAITAHQPVFTSVSRVGPFSYGSGHIIAVFGDAEPLAPHNQQNALAILNSAIKINQVEANMCSLSAGDEKYRAEVYLTKDYTLKNFTGLGYSLMWLERAKLGDAACVAID